MILGGCWLLLEQFSSEPSLSATFKFAVQVSVTYCQLCFAVSSDLLLQWSGRLRQRKLNGFRGQVAPQMWMGTIDCWLGSQSVDLLFSVVVFMSSLWCLCQFLRIRGDDFELVIQCFDCAEYQYHWHLILYRDFREH